MHEHPKRCGNGTDPIQFQRIEPQPIPGIVRALVNGSDNGLAVTVPPGSQKPCRKRGRPTGGAETATLALSACQYKQLVLEQMHRKQR